MCFDDRGDTVIKARGSCTETSSAANAAIKEFAGPSGNLGSTNCFYDRYLRDDTSCVDTAATFSAMIDAHLWRSFVSCKIATPPTSVTTGTVLTTPRNTTFGIVIPNVTLIAATISAAESTTSTSRHANVTTDPPTDPEMFVRILSVPFEIEAGCKSITVAFEYGLGASAAAFAARVQVADRGGTIYASSVRLLESATTVMFSSLNFENRSFSVGVQLWAAVMLAPAAAMLGEGFDWRHDRLLYTTSSWITVAAGNHKRTSTKTTVSAATVLTTASTNATVRTHKKQLDADIMPSNTHRVNLKVSESSDDADNRPNGLSIGVVTAALVMFCLALVSTIYAVRMSRNLQHKSRFAKGTTTWDDDDFHEAYTTSMSKAKAQHENAASAPFNQGAACTSESSTGDLEWEEDFWTPARGNKSVSGDRPHSIPNGFLLDTSTCQEDAHDMSHISQHQSLLAERLGSPEGRTKLTEGRSMGSSQEESQSGRSIVSSIHTAQPGQPSTAWTAFMSRNFANFGAELGLGPDAETELMNMDPSMQPERNTDLPSHALLELEKGIFKMRLNSDESNTDLLELEGFLGSDDYNVDTATRHEDVDAIKQTKKKTVNVSGRHDHTHDQPVAVRMDGGPAHMTARSSNTSTAVGMLDFDVTAGRAEQGSTSNHGRKHIGRAEQGSTCMDCRTVADGERDIDGNGEFYCYVCWDSFEQVESPTVMQLGASDSVGDPSTGTSGFTSYVNSYDNRQLPRTETTLFNRKTSEA